jgi:hypothetical protein
MSDEYAKYIGTATTRRMTSVDWESAGIKDQKTVVFGRANGYTVPRADFTDEAWAKLSEDTAIVVVGEKGNPAAEYEARVEAARTRMRASAANKRAIEQQPAPEAAAEPQEA